MLHPIEKPYITQDIGTTQMVHWKQGGDDSAAFQYLVLRLRGFAINDLSVGDMVITCITVPMVDYLIKKTENLMVLA